MSLVPGVCSDSANQSSALSKHRFCCVEISLLCSRSHPALIILSQVHLPYRRLDSETCLIIIIIIIMNFTIHVFKKRLSGHLMCQR